MPHFNPYQPFLRMERFRLHCRAEEQIHLPGYIGSALRGVFGHGLKRTVCVTGNSNCADCLLYRSCVYPYVFETPPPPETERMRKYPAAPHPFVLAVDLEQPATIDIGQTLPVEITLIGRAIAHLPYVVEAFRVAGRGGLGRQRGRFQVARVDQWMGGSDWHMLWDGVGALVPQPRAPRPTPPAAPREHEVTIEFLTPLRVTRDGHLVRPDDFQFHDLFRTLLRRISSLAYFHEEVSLEEDFAGLSAASRDMASVASSLRWYDWSRFSSRQRAKMKMGGLLGWVRFAGADLVPFWPYLWLGQFTHAGKGASMGLGAYRISECAGENGR